MSRKKRMQKKAEKTKKAEQKRQAYSARITAAKGRRKKKSRRAISEGKAYIKSTFNNTTITITDTKGEVVAWSSAGNVGFRGSKKSTPYAASVAAKTAASKAVDMGMGKVDVFVKGVGSGRDSAIRSLDSAGLTIVAIKDVTPLPHNGPRPRKPRRV